jgi:hypothetical protein
VSSDGSEARVVLGGSHAVQERRADAGAPDDYWQAVIGALPAEKRDAAWRFYAERELGRAHEARDTLSGLVLLLEANGLFLERCARTLQQSAARASASPEALAESFAPILGRLEALERRLAPAGPEETPPRTVGRVRGRFLGALGLALALLLLAAGAFLGARAWAKHELRRAKRAYGAGAHVMDVLRAQGGELRAYPSSDPATGTSTWVLEVRPGQRKVLHAGVNAQGAAVVSLSR